MGVSGRHFVDPSGGVVLLRGVNLAGDSKVPPFAPNVGTADLDRIAGLGFNVIRLVFIWEAFEPSPSDYDDGYLAAVAAVAASAWDRGIYVIVDIHQDGFSRFASHGVGDGFPRWTVSPRGTASIPDNGPDRRKWAITMALDPTSYKSFHDFYRDTYGVRSRYLAMLARLAETFSGVPGVVGYDLLNEPWGNERRELGPLYRDSAAVVRSRHPSAILFCEGQFVTNTGLRSRLRRPVDGPVAYAPHYYDPLLLGHRRWHRPTILMNNGFRHMTGTSRAWDAPLFVSEFGMDAGIERCGDYIDEIYDRLDANFASGAQWNVTPGWTPDLKDGWNGEDFTILDPSGRIRPNFRLRPYPRRTAGVPVRFCFRRAERDDEAHVAEFAWHHRPDRGVTEIFLPDSLFPPDSRIVVRAAEPGVVVEVRRDLVRQILIVRTDRPTPISLVVRSGGRGPR